MELNDKVAVITGGTGGIGLTLARASADDPDRWLKGMRRLKARAEQQEAQ